MKQFIGIFILYVNICFTMELGTILENQNNSYYVVSFKSAGKTPEILQKVSVFYENQLVYGEVVGIYGEYCWVSIKRANTILNKSRGLIRRYTLTDIYLKTKIKK